MHIKKNSKIHNSCVSMNLPVCSSSNLDEIIQNEYDEFFQNILNYSKEDFLNSIYERSLLTVRKKFNGNLPSNFSKLKVIKYVLENCYLKDIKTANFVLKAIQKKVDKNPSACLFNGRIIPHCLKGEEGKGILHSCQDTFHYFNYQRTINSGESINEIYLVCLSCCQIYKQNLIKCLCEGCHSDFYSKIKTEEEENELEYATWKQYHCNAIINDRMKCVNCKNFLLFNQKENILLCKECNLEFKPLDLIWKCAVCKNEFNSEAKPYNPLEYKNMKISVKDTLINKIKAKPEKNICSCNIDITKTKFFHKSTCKGELYLGSMNNKKILVCSKCEALNFFDHFQWTCPICENKCPATPSKNIKNISRNILIKYDSNQKINGSQMKENKSNEKSNHKEKICNTSAKKIKYMIPAPTPNRSTNKKREKDIYIRSPLKKLKVNLAKRFSEEDMEEEEKKNEFNFNENDFFKRRDSPSLKSKESKKDFSDSRSGSTGVSYNQSSSSSSYLNESSYERIGPLTKEDFQKALENFQANSDFDVEDYIPKKQIGEGSFGKIYLVEDYDGREYAMKKIIGASPKDMKSLQNEYNILILLNEMEKKLNLVRVYGLQTKQLDLTTSALYVLMDLADCDWENEIKRKMKLNERYTEKELLNIAKDLIKTFASLQKIGISHRDIKPQNILVFNTYPKQYKLADFGEAKNILKIYDSTDKQTLRGTELYMSPILFQALRSDYLTKYVEHNVYKSDVFSFGICLLYAAGLGHQIIYDIREEYDDRVIKRTLEKYLRKYYSGKLIELLSNMILVDE
ncbi:MAG: protein kinase family protein, partial [archaeon]|nr:protein kinase family protein [archaeon]